MGNKKHSDAPGQLSLLDQADELSGIEWTALAKIAEKKAKDVRDKLPVGDGQPVDFSVHVCGCVNIGGQAPTTETEQPEKDHLLALVLELAGPRKQKEILDGVQRLFRAFTQTPAKGEEWGKLPEPRPEALGLAIQLIAATQRKRANVKRGSVTASVKVERLAA